MRILGYATVVLLLLGIGFLVEIQFDSAREKAIQFCNSVKIGESPNPEKWKEFSRSLALRWKSLPPSHNRPGEFTAHGGFMFVRKSCNVFFEGGKIIDKNLIL